MDHFGQVSLVFILKWEGTWANKYILVHVIWDECYFHNSTTINIYNVFENDVDR